MIGRGCIRPGCPNLAEAGTSTCAKHVRGGGRSRPCLVCRRPTQGGDFCSRAHEEEHRLKTEPYRAGYTDPEYRRARAERYDLAGGRCESHGCGIPLKGHLFPNGADWEADHVVELSEGGTNDVTNLRCRCLPHHHAKTRASRRARGR